MADCGDPQPALDLSADVRLRSKSLLDVAIFLPQRTHADLGPTREPFNRTHLARSTRGDGSAVAIDFAILGDSVDGFIVMVGELARGFGILPRALAF